MFERCFFWIARGPYRECENGFSRVSAVGKKQGVIAVGLITFAAQTPQNKFVFMTSPGHALKFEKSWLFGQLVVRLPAVPFVNASWPQFISRPTHPFFELQRSLQMNVPGEPESMVAIMKISIIFEVVKTRLTAA